MRVGRLIRVQLVVFAVITVVAAGIMAFGYIKLPAMFGVGRYTVTMELPRSGGLYPGGNVTYRGTKVGKVKSIHLTDRGNVEAELSLYSGTSIPSDLQAEVHSQSAVGEQYVGLLPRDGNSAPLTDGSVIAQRNVSVPPDVDGLLDDANRGLKAIPHDSLKTTIDESFTAIGGLGPELSRLVRGSTTIAGDARANLDSLTTLIDQSPPIFDSQVQTSDEIHSWAAHLATVTAEMRDNDAPLAGLIDQGGHAAAETRALIDRLQPTVPVLLANLVTVGKVALAYQPALEQLLVLVPQGVANLQAGSVANLNTKQPFKGSYLDFDLNFNLPPPCLTGFLPAQQRRAPADTTLLDRPAGNLYCRTPQGSPFNVRGAKNLPCLTVPGKRAPTVKMCESNDQYVPLNDGYNWKGDPNATLSGQDIPQNEPGTTPFASTPPVAAAPPPLAVAGYDPGTGNYVGPDGRMYTQRDLATNAPKENTWQSMLTPPTGN